MIGEGTLYKQGTILIAQLHKYSPTTAFMHIFLVRAL